MQVILTSYDTLRVDTAALADLHPHAVIYDEAHKLKNSKSKQYEAALALPTKYRYGLSGKAAPATASPEHNFVLSLYREDFPLDRVQPGSGYQYVCLRLPVFSVIQDDQVYIMRNVTGHTDRTATNM